MWYVEHRLVLQEYLAEHPAQVELDQLKAKYADLNAEHADLLELLTDGDDKVRSYRERLKRIGEPVSSTPRFSPH